MGRASKYNWDKLYLEYCQGRNRSIAEFAEKKGLSYDVLRKQLHIPSLECGLTV
ncbi:hypothetical protein Psfp_03325 [Pelotomaculum sp. FP]|uniref:hypothetical protein n=1 Tax=Pelotomaculum sp. FP TaxID=261474 RepID=UPI001100C5F6|nr:hypothetical protein [Pelotomaculum sp. FP]TEB13909.1 hypothetical protein Psfp_03325 [Pelotomaculum sp. FP]